MAEAVLGSLLLNIGSALVLEQVKSTLSFVTSDMRNFFNEMKAIKDELESIRGFLHDAERFSDTYANIKIFTREIRGVAFDIEDIVDEFTCKFSEPNKGGLEKTLQRLAHVKTWSKLTKKLRKIRTKLADIKNRKTVYDPSGNVKIEEHQEVRKLRTAEDELFKKESDLVGIDENKKKLMEMLSDDGSDHNVISVWGMGGVGKTTLVTHVYKTVKKSFGGYAWITVSKKWERDQLLKKILEELHRENPNGITIDGIERMDFRSLVQKIQNYMQNKRCLLILDDVWTTDLWDFLRDIIIHPDGNAVRIILTTRIQEVALLAPEQQIMKIIPLGKHHSWDLFCKTAFKENNTNTCPVELTMWARKIVERCGGLPLAILAIGGVMASKEQTEREWKRMWDDLEHELAHNPDIENSIVKLGFAELSSNLKNCLLYCGIYPEDYHMEAVHMTRQWIVEGFVQTSERRTQEEVAEDYLNELVRRCLLQVVKKDVDGRVEMCSMHDIIHNMVVSKSEEEQFCVVHGTSTFSPRGRVRRVSIQNCNLENASNNEYSFRSIFTFRSKISPDSLSQILRYSKLLRVLVLHRTYMKILPEEVCNLLNLHYLGLNETGMTKLPKSIGRLQNLKYLYAYGTNIREFPNEFAKLQRLRELFLNPLPVMPPEQIWQLKNLQVMGFIKATNEMVRNLKTLTKLRRLYILEIRSEHCEDLFTAISKFSHLEELSVKAKEGEVLQFQALNTSASVMKFSGQVERTSVPQFSRSLLHHKGITKLELFNNGLDENSFSCLQEIHSLRILYLTGYEGNELCFNEISFLMLRELRVRSAPHLERIEIKKGAMANLEKEGPIPNLEKEGPMPKLEKLYISNCLGLKEIPRGIEYLSKLQLISWGKPNGTLKERVRREMTEQHVSEDRMRILRLIKFT